MNQIKNKDVPATPARINSIYPMEFRRDSVAAWRVSGLSVPKYAGQIGVHCTTLYAWIHAERSPLPGVAGGGATHGEVAVAPENRLERGRPRPLGLFAGGSEITGRGPLAANNELSAPRSQVRR